VSRLHYVDGPPKLQTLWFGVFLHGTWNSKPEFLLADYKPPSSNKWSTQLNLSCIFSRNYTTKTLSILPTNVEWHNSNGHIDGRPSERVIWFRTSRIKCGIPNQITCSQTLVGQRTMKSSLICQLPLVKSTLQKHAFVFLLYVLTNHPK